MTRDWSDRRVFQDRYWKWARRARVVARLCRDDHWVCDIGCGMQPLRWFLPKGSIYLPADLVRWSEDTEFCDLNAGRLPLCSLTLCDVAVMIGLVEYIEDLESLLSQLSDYAEFIAFTYNPTDTYPKRAWHWVCHLSEKELFSILDRRGFGVEHKSQFGQHRRLLVRARNKKFSSSQRERRDDARSQAARPRPGRYVSWQRLRHQLLTYRVLLHTNAT